MDDTTSSIELLFKEYTNASESTDAIRDKIIDQLVNSLPSLNYDIDTSKQVEAKVGVIKALDEILKSKEAAKINKITTYLKRKDTENTANYQESVIAVLSKLDPEQFRKGKVTLVDDLDDKLDDKFESTATTPITAGETEASPLGHDD